MQNKRTHIVFFLVCVIALTTVLGLTAHATSLVPWENENSIKALLAQQLQEGQSVLCEGTVCKIAARNNPAYFVIEDAFRSITDGDTRIVVVGRVPVTLGCGQAVRVQGVFGRLPNNEPCVLNPTVEEFFDERTDSPVYWTPFFEFMIGYRTQVLPVPITSIPPSDPSLADDGMGIACEVSAYTTEGISRFDTVASLLATAPPVLTPVELACRPIVSVGDGYILVGDDNSDSVVKIYTNVEVKSTDRIIKLTGVTHSEAGRMVLYAGAGPSPYFDGQSSCAGGVSFASVGSVAYASTLNDAASASISAMSGVRVMSVSTPSSSDGSWVYLTGQVVTYVGQYYSYAIANPDWVYVYDIQSLDRTSGIRVWSPVYGPSYVGSVVDVMAKVDTKDGQRMLGIWSNDSYDAVNINSATHSVEAKILADGYEYYYPANVVPVGLINRDLCGASMGNNPGVTGGQGLYNIGSYVTVWGKVLETGTKQFDQYGYYTTPYMVIDDGSGTPTDDQDVTVFGTNSYSWWYDPVVVDDYISVTGVSSIWKPSGSTDTFRCVWTSDYARNQGDPPQQSTREVTETGTISGTVKLYDMPESTATVRVYSTCGKSETLTVNRGQDNSGSATFSWTGIPKTVLVDSYWQDYPEYIVSAKCDGYKTRTYAQVTPWAGTAAPRNLYLTRLRKIYVTTDTTTIDSCSGGYYPTSTVITATVRDADHNPVQGLTVRFKTDKGSFSSGSIVHTYTPGSTTNSQGQVTATLYGVPSEYGQVTVEATDDSAPLAGDDPDDDTYKYDWQQLHDNYGQPTYVTINSPSVSVALSANPSSIARCSDSSTVTATLTYCSGTAAPAGIQVTFSVSGTGVFQDGSTYATVNTVAGGTGTVQVRANDNHDFGVANVSAWAYVYGGYGSGNTDVTIVEHSPTVVGSANPASIYSAGDSTITFTATHPDGSAYSNVPLTIQTSAGSFVGKTNPFTQSTGVDGKVTVTLHLDPAQSAKISATYNDNCVGSTTVDTQVIYRQAQWKTVGVNYSSPLVADLIPGDGKEVAVISKDDGKICLWKSDGTQATVSTEVIDDKGNNTLSAADIDNRGDLELCAPGGDIGYYGNNQVYMFGYDASASTFKPLAGWPASTPSYQFHKAAVALGDANLDGTMKAVGADYCCYVLCWNSTGGMLWTQITGSTGTSVENSSVALGDINPVQDSDHIPDALVGAETTPGMWGYAGDEWHDYTPSYSYTAGWQTPNVTSIVMCSPVIGHIDGDSYNDIAVGDEDGVMWVWLSSDSTWHSYRVADTSDQHRAIRSSPVLANLDGQTCIIFGCNNGKVFALHANGTSVSGWSGGILLRSGTRIDPEDGYSETPFSVRTSPLVGNVLTETNDPQVIVGCIDGNVYALWKDGTNHSGGPVAKVWTCVQTDDATILSTPTLCSLNGTSLDLIVGSTDGIYRISFPTITFDPYNTTRWPWTTFHYDAARTGCTTSPSSTKVSASVIGRVRTSAGVWLSGTQVYIKDLTTNQNPVVYNRSGESRPTYISTVGDGTNNNEISEGGYVINQLTPGRNYLLTFKRTGYADKTYTLNNATTGINTIPDTVY
ncbi:MAG: Ig-like domain-containing protein [Armatimonadota bacterium]